MYVNIREVAHLVQGINSSRLTDEEGKKNTYSKILFDEDKYNLSSFNFVKTKNNSYMDEGFLLEENDVIINLFTAEATLVSCKSQGKILTSNFLKVDLDNSKINSVYFIYYFNENKELKSKIHAQMQGITLVQKVSKQSIYKLMIYIPDMEVQNKIAQIYIKMISIKQQYENISKYLEDASFSAIESIIKNDSKNK